MTQTTELSHSVLTSFIPELTAMMNATSGVDVDDDFRNENQMSAELHMRIVYIALGTFGVTGTTFVAMVMFNFPELRKKITNMLIVNQSFIDFIESVLIGTLSMT